MIDPRYELLRHVRRQPLFFEAEHPAPLVVALARRQSQQGFDEREPREDAETHIGGCKGHAIFLVP